MAAPTLKDLLKAISEMRGDVARVERGQTEMRGEMATKSDVEKVEAKVDAHRAETAAGFDRIERELEAHADTAHRDLDEDIAAIHKGLVRANVRGIPKELRSPQSWISSTTSIPSRVAAARSATRALHTASRVAWTLS